MTLQLDIADRVRTVELQRTRNAYEVTVDGRPRLVEAARVGPDSWLLLVREPGGLPARSVEATVVRQTREGSANSGNGTVDVHINGYWIPVHVRNGPRPESRYAGRPSVEGPQRLSAPMPGRVVRVLVKPGDLVKPRQGLVVVEAMKMENELRATGEGRVCEVFVIEGQSVEAGTALVVIE